jgi:hypothetical protein
VPDALVAVCRRHHVALHQRAGELDLAVVTDLMIARSRRRWMLLRPLPPGTGERLKTRATLP